jgi:hypothetical protein
MNNRPTNDFVHETPLYIAMLNCLRPIKSDRGMVANL